MTEAALGGPAAGYPAMAAARDRVEAAPRRVRGVFNGAVVFDTRRALYVWEVPYYPAYYIPLEDVVRDLLVGEGHEMSLRLGRARRHALRVADQTRDHAARVYEPGSDLGLGGFVRFEWEALDAWFEEDEEIFVHPRNPYVRVDALRSRSPVRIELEGLVLAESDAPVLVFETGLPTRYYVDRTDVRWEHLVPSPTETSCPYKGTTSDYWSARTPTGLHDDIAWSYQFTTDALRAVAGLVAFYDEKVDVVLGGVRQLRRGSHFG